jgi:glycosyltransferase involved in cell wall biosynthesis
MTANNLAGVVTTSLPFSVGIMAYNEGANIANAINAILTQRLSAGHVAELIVVASGCTDNTVPIVAGIARNDTRVRCIVQERREGKASAINEFLGIACSPVLMMVGADVVLKEGSLDALLSHFNDPAVGMVGAHPIPVNDERTFLGFVVHLLWNLHDRVARESPKLGEVVAFRNVVPSIPFDTPVDEISIQALIEQLGYRVVYEPHAIVYNRGPATVSDFLRQRRRIHAGHLRIRKRQGYSASTMSVRRIGQALFMMRPFASPRATCWTIGAIALEAWARYLGLRDYLRRRPQHLWQVATTTKSHIAEEATAQIGQTVLVFHVVNFRQQELELGMRSANLLAQQIVQRMRQTLDGRATVAAERSGTIVALAPMEREEAEYLAMRLITNVEAAPFHVNGQREGVAIKLGCGIISFLQAGNALALSLPAPAVEGVASL